MVLRAPRSVEVGLDLKVFSMKGTWEPNDDERRAAWELYVELITRVATVPLEHGLLRESLTSLYTIFGSSREILRRYGPTIAEPKPDGQYNFGFICVAMLNFVLRPTLSRWHPELESWEQRRLLEVSRLEHERAWPQHAALRGELEYVRTVLSRYAAVLATACGVPDLLDAVTQPR